jgi:hypothetical protein
MPFGVVSDPGATESAAGRRRRSSTATSAPALPKVQRFSGFVTADEHEDQPSNSYRQDAADQNQFSWHKFSCRLC